MSGPGNLIMRLMGAGSKGIDAGELRKFLSDKQGPKNKNVNIGGYDAYLRKSSPRYVERSHRLERPLDLASISRKDGEGSVKKLPEGQRGPKGKFREMLALLEDEAAREGHDSVYVEQILNEFLPDVLRSAGYNEDVLNRQMGNSIPAMWKRLKRP